MEPWGFGGMGIIFSLMFTIVPVIIFLVFIFVFGTIIYRTIHVAKDKKKPIIPVRAKVVSKRTQLHGGNNMHHDMHTHAHTYYYATFEFENGERMELAIPSHHIGYIVEGDTGILSFQGNLFVKFDRM